MRSKASLLLSHTLNISLRQEFHILNSNYSRQNYKACLVVRVRMKNQRFIKSFRTRLKSRLTQFIYQSMSRRDLNDLYAHILITFQHAKTLNQNNLRCKLLSSSLLNRSERFWFVGDELEGDFKVKKGWKLKKKGCS